MNNITNLEAIKAGAKAGAEYAESKDFDKDSYKENLEKVFAWADEINLAQTVGNVYVLSTMASLRVLLGDELFDTPVTDDQGDFSEEKMIEAQNIVAAKLAIVLEAFENEGEPATE